jgi:orotidine-5'-phosphate decarboxylase
MPKGLRDIPLEERLIVALDMDEADAIPLVKQLQPQVKIFKVGLQLLFSSGGLAVIPRLGDLGVEVFLDMKMLDIPETVVRALNEIQVHHKNIVFATIHSFNRGLKTALELRERSGLRVLVVTLLTSMDDGDLQSLGISKTAKAWVMDQTHRAAEEGCDGVIASGLEASEIHRAHKDLMIVTPAIRPSWSRVLGDDQKRIATPRDAILNGADHIVVGRPIYRHPPEDGGPEEATRRILQEIRVALDEREESPDSFEFDGPKAAFG